MKKPEVYKPHNKLRIVTAASLFDGHDAAINVMRRIIQSSGAEVIHLGHDRSVEEVVNCAIQEDAQAIAMTSYQGGHMEYFKYMYDLLQEKGAKEGREQAAKWHDAEVARITNHWDEHKDKHVRAGSDTVLFMVDLKKWHQNAATALRNLPVKP